LQLNPMTANAERVIPVVRSESSGKLLELLLQEKVTPYTDGNWRKCFRKGGSLEWFNDPGPNMEPWIGIQAIVDIGTREDWMRDAGERFDRAMSEIPEA